MKTSKTFRNIEAYTFNEFKKTAKANGLNLGFALSCAMQLFNESREGGIDIDSPPVIQYGHLLDLPLSAVDSFVLKTPRDETKALIRRVEVYGVGIDEPTKIKVTLVPLVGHKVHPVGAWRG